MQKFNKATVATGVGILASLVSAFFPQYTTQVQYFAPLAIGLATYFVPNAQ